MVKRSGVDVVAAAVRGHALPSPGLKEAPVLELMCSHFVLTLAAKQGPKFNVRRDLNGLLSLTGRHLVWPAPVLQRLREFLGRRCAGRLRRRARHGSERHGYDQQARCGAKDHLHITSYRLVQIMMLPHPLPMR